MVTVNWQGGLAFEADPPSGVKWVMDAGDGQKVGHSPLEGLLAAVAACSAVDVVIVLEKKRQKIASYRIEIDGVRTRDGEYPRPFVEMTIRHILTGEGLDPLAVQRAVELSDQKYCTVIATLRQSPAIKSEWVIEDQN